VQGNGMGLYIVRIILDSLDGNIRVESKEGEGTAFTITLRQHPGDGEAPENTEDYVVSAVTDNLPVQVLERKAPFSPAKYSILIVDDNETMRAFLRASLDGKYNIFTAESAREALLKIDTFPELQVIVSDVMMDDLDGHAFLDELSKNIRYGDIPFIFLTAKHDENDKLAGLAQGAIDYIEKPFSMDELSNKIGTLISFREKQRKAEASRIEREIAGILFGKKCLKQDHEYYLINDMSMKYRLSAREQEILALLLQKTPHKEIALGLNIVLRTVEFHIVNIYKKFGVKDRYELYALFNKRE
jgi:DNA-binding NarL/FixJ family response regulator